MYGGTIEGNTAAKGAGGVFLGDGNFKVGSDNGTVVTIKDNMAGKLPSDVALYNKAPGDKIMIDGSLSEKSRIGVKLTSFPDNVDKVQITSGMGDNSADIFFSNDFNTVLPGFDLDIIKAETSDGTMEAFAVPITHGDKDPNPIKISSKTIVKTITVKYKKLRKKSQTLSAKKIMNVTNAKTKVTYKKVSVNKKSSKFKVNKNTGALTIKKGTKKGLYKIKIKVSAAKSNVYASTSKTVLVKVRVK